MSKQARGRISMMDNWPLHLLSKIEPMMDDRGCWEWTASRSSNGYPQIVLRQPKRNVQASRFVVYLETGVWSDRMRPVMHSCDNKGCVNPAHLSIGTALENFRDAVKRGLVPPQKSRKLTNSQATQLRRDHAALGLTYKALGERYGVHWAVARNIVLNKTYRIGMERTWR